MYWVVRKVRADVKGKLKRRKFKFYIKYTFIKLYRLVGTNFPDNPIYNLNVMYNSINSDHYILQLYYMHCSSNVRSFIFVLTNIMRIETETPITRVNAAPLSIRVRCIVQETIHSWKGNI